MNLIDAFYFVFKSDAKEETANVEKLDAAQTKLENNRKKTAGAESIGYGVRRRFQKEQLDLTKQQQEQTEKLNVSFSKLALGGVAALGAFFSIAKLKNGIIDAVNYNAEIEKTAKLTGINARELSVWNNMIARAGGNPGSTDYLNFITSLNKQYGALGINTRLPQVNMSLGELADKIKELNDAVPGSGYAFAQKFGIPDDFYLALKNGKKALEENLAVIQKYDNTTEDLTQQSLDLKQEWAVISTIWHSIGNDLLPVEKLMTSIAKKVSEIFEFSLAGKRNPIGWIVGAAQGINNLIRGKSGVDNSSTSLPAEVSPGFQPRGIRSNNPGNLQPGGIESVFPSLQAGTDAEQAQLGRYGSRGINTLRKVAASWPDRAHAASWLATVSRTSGIGPDQQINLSDPIVQAKVGNAINVAENGAAYGNLIGAARNGLNEASQTPLSPSVSNSSKSITIGNITINSQATDAKGIASDLHQQLKDTVNSYDDGVKY